MSMWYKIWVLWGTELVIKAGVGLRTKIKPCLEVILDPYSLPMMSLCQKVPNLLSDLEVADIVTREVV